MSSYILLRKYEIHHYSLIDNLWVVHRDGAPAVICGDVEYWYQYGLCHREDGAAIVAPDKAYWFWRGKFITCESQKLFEQLVKIRNFW